jgi:hypothetical protein
MMVEFEYAAFADAAVVGPGCMVKRTKFVNSASGTSEIQRVSCDGVTTRELPTSGRNIKHRLHFDLVASVIRRCLDHTTPDEVCVTPFLGRAHNRPVSALRGGSSTKPGGIVQT